MKKDWVGGRVFHTRTWDEKLGDYVRFLDQQNQSSSQYAIDSSERVLFYWLRIGLQNGVLLPERISKFNQALPIGAASRLAASVALRSARAVGKTVLNNSPSTGAGTEEIL